MKSARKLVMAGELELDIVRLIKKLKVAERSLRKKELWKDFKPKVFETQTVPIENIPAAEKKREREEEEDR